MYTLLVKMLCLLQNSDIFNHLGLCFHFGGGLFVFGAIFRRCPKSYSWINFGREMTFYVLGDRFYSCRWYKSLPFVQICMEHTSKSCQYYQFPAMWADQEGTFIDVLAWNFIWIMVLFLKAKWENHAFYCGDSAILLSSILLRVYIFGYRMGLLFLNARYNGYSYFKDELIG